MFYDILKQLCTQHNTTPTALLKQLNISPSKGTVWKNGADPSVKYLILFADFFGVSIDYLLGRNSDEQKNIACHSTFQGNGTVAIANEQKVEDFDKHKQENQEILNLIDSLSLKDKAKIINQLYEIEENYKKEG